MIFESMTSKPRAGGGSKDCIPWKIDKAVCYFVQIDEVTTNSSSSKSIRGAFGGELAHKGRGEALLQTSERYHNIFKVGANKRFL